MPKLDNSITQPQTEATKTVSRCGFFASFAIIGLLFPIFILLISKAGTIDPTLSEPVVKARAVAQSCLGQRTS